MSSFEQLQLRLDLTARTLMEQIDALIRELCSKDTSCQRQIRIMQQSLKSCNSCVGKLQRNQLQLQREQLQLQHKQPQLGQHLAMQDGTIHNLFLEKDQALGRFLRLEQDCAVLMENATWLALPQMLRLAKDKAMGISTPNFRPRVYGNGDIPPEVLWALHLLLCFLNNMHVRVM